MPHGDCDYLSGSKSALVLFGIQSSSADSVRTGFTSLGILNLVTAGHHCKAKY